MHPGKTRAHAAFTAAGVLVILAAACWTAAGGASREEFSYRQRTGARESVNTWTRVIVNPGRVELTAVKSLTGEYDLIICNDRYETLEWFYTRAAGGTSLHAVRNNKAIRITGTVRGKAVDRTIPLETAAWYQFAEFAISRMLADRRDSVTYSLFWPDKMSFYVMKASRIGEERISLGGKEIGAIKVKVTLDGFKSIFWSSHYWFRSSDLLFVRYEGVNGLPGTAATVLELIGR